MFIDSWRGHTRRALAAPLAGTLVAGAAAFAVVASPAPASAADQQLEADFTYKCRVVADDLDIGVHDVGINAKVAVPDGVTPGETIPGRKTQITLTLSETLRHATVDILHGEEASGFSDDAAVELTINDEAVDVPIANLASPKLPIPTSDAEPWTIPTEGDVPAIEVPEDAAGLIDMGMPDKFSVKAVVYRSTDTDMNVTMDCTGPRNRNLGSIPIVQSIDENYAYVCGVVAGDIDLGDQQIGVRTQVDVPGAVKAGESVPARDTQLTLTLPEALRAATVDLLKGVTAGGASEDAAVGVTIGGETQSYPIEGLSAPQTPIPTAAGEPWVIPTQGQVPAIAVPKDASGEATISMPDAFKVAASIVTSEDKTIPATMDCAIADGASTNLATIGIQERPAPRTDTRTKASSPQVAYGHQAKVKVSVSPKAKGKVRVFKRSRSLGTAKLNAQSKATIALGKTKLKPGRHELKVRYLGNDAFKGSKDTTALKVTKAGSKVGAKVLTKKVVAKKTRARVRVQVSANGVKPSGAVKLRVGGKVVGKARVSKGVATVRLKTFGAAGAKKVRVQYLGSKTVKAGAATVKLRVVRKR